jgi:hypothetical protein
MPLHLQTFCPPPPKNHCALNVIVSSVLSVQFLLCATLFFLLTARPTFAQAIPATLTTPSLTTNHLPLTASKKGLQVQMVDDALALGIKHAALNVNFAGLLTVSPTDTNANFTINERALENLDRQVKPLSDANVVISLILLYYKSGNEALDKLMLHPKYDPAAPNNLSQFNTSNPKSAAAFSACVEALAARYSPTNSPRGRVLNYIVGNEVNSHWFWANMGRTTMEEFADDYLRAVRATHTAVRKHSDDARVYLSLEHHWNIRYPGGDERQTFPARPFIEYFARRAKEGGDFDWHIAFHPYPENLFDCRTWNDKSATHSADTSRITFKNIEQLTAFLRRPELLYNGQPRRVILSEQGFHSTDKPDGELLQAAAYAYAYQKIRDLDGIDSFILHRHVDHGNEGGLNLGLWTRDKSAKHLAQPLAKKKIYEVFQAADTPAWQEAFRFALPIIGITDWSEIKRTNP